MEGINIQIEPSKTYFSDGCVDTTGPDEIDLLREEPKTVFEESVSVAYNILLLLLIY